jgi:hypothetical protein
MNPIRIRTQTLKSGTIEFDPICDLCNKKGNYPMAGWDKMEEETWICLDCLEELGFKLHHYEENDNEEKDEGAFKETEN